MRTRYRIDDYQQAYFVIDSFENLLAQRRDADFALLYDRLRESSAMEVAGLLPSDRVLTPGTQGYTCAQVSA